MARIKTNGKQLKDLNIGDIVRYGPVSSVQTLYTEPNSTIPENVPYHDVLVEYMVVAKNHPGYPENSVTLMPIAPVEYAQYDHIETNNPNVLDGTGSIEYHTSTIAMRLNTIDMHAPLFSIFSLHYVDSGHTAPLVDIPSRYVPDVNDRGTIDSDVTAPSRGTKKFLRVNTPDFKIALPYLRPFLIFKIQDSAIAPPLHFITPLPMPTKIRTAGKNGEIVEINHAVFLPSLNEMGFGTNASLDSNNRLSFVWERFKNVTRDKIHTKMGKFGEFRGIPGFSSDDMARGELTVLRSENYPNKLGYLRDKNVPAITWNNPNIGYTVSYISPNSWAATVRPSMNIHGNAYVEKSIDGNYYTITHIDEEALEYEFKPVDLENFKFEVYIKNGFSTGHYIDGIYINGEYYAYSPTGHPVALNRGSAEMFQEAREDKTNIFYEAGAVVLQVEKFNLVRRRSKLYGTNTIENVRKEWADQLDLSHIINSSSNHKIELKISMGNRVIGPFYWDIRSEAAKYKSEDTWAISISDNILVATDLQSVKADQKSSLPISTAMLTSAPRNIPWVGSSTHQRINDREFIEDDRVFDLMTGKYLYHLKGIKLKDIIRTLVISEKYLVIYRYVDAPFNKTRQIEIRKLATEDNYMQGLDGSTVLKTISISNLPKNFHDPTKFVIIISPTRSQNPSKRESFTVFFGGVSDCGYKLIDLTRPESEWNLDNISTFNSSTQPHIVRIASYLRDIKKQNIFPYGETSSTPNWYANTIKRKSELTYIAVWPNIVQVYYDGDGEYFVFYGTDKWSSMKNNGMNMRFYSDMTGIGIIPKNANLSETEYGIKKNTGPHDHTTLGFTTPYVSVAGESIKYPYDDESTNSIHICPCQSTYSQNTIFTTFEYDSNGLNALSSATVRARNLRYRPSYWNQYDMEQELYVRPDFNIVTPVVDNHFYILDGFGGMNDMVITPKGSHGATGIDAAPFKHTDKIYGLGDFKIRPCHRNVRPVHVGDNDNRHAIGFFFTEAHSESYDAYKYWHPDTEFVLIGARNTTRRPRMRLINRSFMAAYFPLTDSGNGTTTFKMLDPLHEERFIPDAEKIYAAERYWTNNHSDPVIPSSLRIHNRYITTKCDCTVTIVEGSIELVKDEMAKIKFLDEVKEHDGYVEIFYKLKDRNQQPNIPKIMSVIRFDIDIEFFN